jgi:hypothetical protein
MNTKNIRQKYVDSQLSFRIKMVRVLIIKVSDGTR